MTATDPALAAAWDDATPEGWVVGRPYLHDERGVFEEYAFIPSGLPRGSRPNVEWDRGGVRSTQPSWHRPHGVASHIDNGPFVARE